MEFKRQYSHVGPMGIFFMFKAQGNATRANLMDNGRRVKIKIYSRDGNTVIFSGIAPTLASAKKICERVDDNFSGRKTA